jgi:hypothetical protein
MLRNFDMIGVCYLKTDKINVFMGEATSSVAMHALDDNRHNTFMR